jgi:hypothetical protein
MGNLRTLPNTWMTHVTKFLIGQSCGLWICACINLMLDNPLPGENSQSFFCWFALIRQWYEDIEGTPRWRGDDHALESSRGVTGVEKDPEWEQQVNNQTDDSDNLLIDPLLGFMQGTTLCGYFPRSSL